MVELFVMCQTVFQKFSEEKPRENKKTKKKTKKTIFQRYWKAEKCKTKKPRENQKNKKKQSLGEGGGQTRVSKYCFFFLFSRGFFGFALFCFPRPLDFFFFYLFWFFGFLEVFVLFPRGPPQRFSKCHS